MSARYTFRTVRGPSGDDHVQVQIGCTWAPVTEEMVADDWNLAQQAVMFSLGFLASDSSAHADLEQGDN